MVRSAAALKRRAEKRGVTLEVQKLKDKPQITLQGNSKMKTNPSVVLEVVSKEVQIQPSQNKTVSSKKDGKIKSLVSSKKAVKQHSTVTTSVNELWHCNHCNNNNFGFRLNCNRCQRPKTIIEHEKIIKLL